MDWFLEGGVVLWFFIAILILISLVLHRRLIAQYEEKVRILRESMELQKEIIRVQEGRIQQLEAQLQAESGND